MSDSNTFDRFGRYLILDHLVDGGMAKICRARFLGEQADKIVAIKMVQPQFSKDESFKTMFIDEIKTTFGLLHPNIVQTYDYGMHQGQLYVAMEYCDGRNLKEYLDKLKERKFVFPVEISVYIITQVCQGLNYAHTFTDKLTGKEANIIHRDISPHNIMLTYDGAVKVIDFGIAKSEKNSEATQAGTIKGKLSYLAPEYLEGHELDPRYDEFAVGITLWEMLCSRKLFKAANDLAVLKKIQECKVPPPSSINPNVPKELDEIVLKALSRDRNKRFDNLDLLNRALIKFLYANYPDFNATDLSYFAKELFKAEINKDREKLFEYGQIDIAPYLADLKAEQDGVGAPSSAEATGSAVSEEDRKKRKTEQVLDFGFEGDKTGSVNLKKLKGGTDDDGLSLGGSGEKTRAGGKRVKKAGGATRTRTRAGGTQGTKVRRKKGANKTGTRQIRTKRKKESSSNGFGGKVAAAVAALAIGAAYQFGYLDSMMGKTSNQPVAVKPKEENNPIPSPDPTKTARQPASKKVKLTISNLEKRKQRVFVNDQEVKPDFLKNIMVPEGEPFTLRIQAPRKKHYIKKMTIPAGSKKLSVSIPEQEFAIYGYLTMSRTCTVGSLKFSVFGEDRMERLPPQNQLNIWFPVRVSGGIPEETYHTVFIKREGEDFEYKVQVPFQPDGKTDLCDYVK